MDSQDPLFETKCYGQVGFLYPYDIRYDADNLAFCNPLPDGRVQFRLHTEPIFQEAFLVYNDGKPRAAPMQAFARDRRFIYWQTTIQPASQHLCYSFALKTLDGKPVYRCLHGIDHAVEPLDRWQLDLTQYTPFETPAWMRGAVVYQIFPERFANGNPANDPPGTVPWGSPPHWLEFQGGDLQGIVDRLDHLQELGADVLYLNPIFTSPSTHKYDTLDYYHVDPALGGDEALHILVEALHQRDMKIILDASFNHCHPRFFAFQDVIKNGSDSPYANWFTVYEYPIVIRYRPERVPSPQLEWLQDLSVQANLPLVKIEGQGPTFEPTYLAWYNVLDMPKINLTNPDARQYFLDVTAYWLHEFEVDGWRMDVARHIKADFWQDFRRIAKQTRPDCYLLAEIWGDTSPWLQGDQFDATMNYFLHDLSVAYFARQTMDTPTFLDGITRMLALYAPQVLAVTHNLFSSHDVERFLTMCGGDEGLARFKLAYLFLLTMPGAPGIYYGDEIGMQGENDPDCRRAFPWKQPQTWQRDVLDMMQALIRLRRAHPALRYGDWSLLWQNDDAFAFVRQAGDERIVILVNRGAALSRLNLPISCSSTQVLWGQATASGGASLTVQALAAENGAVILLK